MIGAAVVIAVGLAFALLPFARPAGVGPTTEAGIPIALSRNCSAPVVSAFRHDIPGGWYGYAPLTQSLPNLTGPSCQPKAQHRLAWAVALVILGALMLRFALRPRTRPFGPEAASA